MPRVHSYTVLHYGLSYLSTALQSTQDLVDKQFVFYTSHPSHGHVSNIPPIESRDEIMASIPEPLWKKVYWIDTDNFWEEGQQRDFALSVASREADFVLVQDYDEIYSLETLDKILGYVWDKNNARNHLVNMRHMWRSFDYSCTDDGWPVRIIDLRHSERTTSYVPRELGDIWHFGYAVTDKVMRYKWTCHGHLNELRPNWYEEKWLAWPPVEDCHPTNGRKENGEGWWDPKPYDKFLLPEIMRNHPYWEVEKVE